jgi:hypothetical protein
MFKYLIYDENNELMRKTVTRAEAKAICSIREGWYFKYIKTTKLTFLDAPF